MRTFTYRIEVANNHNRAETVRVRENYPVSDVEEVRARLTDKTTTPKEHDEKQGLLMWELEIAPEKKQSVLLDYQVTLPKDFEWKE